MIEFKQGTGIYLYEGTPELKDYAQGVCSMIEEASKDKNTALAIRTIEYIAEKLRSGKAILATHNEKVIGFCYIETWEHGRFVANSGLIVSPDYRKTGLANKIKEMAFKLSEKKFPTAKIFGLTTSAAVMKINSGLGYRPVTFSELTSDNNFWKGCETCKYFDILTRTERTHCLCTAMVYDPEKDKRNGKKINLEKKKKQKYGETLIEESYN
jgi:N-acetylglutamate synthase-like GNAT family acetyltransferase